MTKLLGAESNESMTSKVEAGQNKRNPQPCIIPCHSKWTFRPWSLNTMLEVVDRNNSK